MKIDLLSKTRMNQIHVACPLTCQMVGFGICAAVALLLSAMGGFLQAQGGVVFEVTSPYHHIRVMDQLGMRTLMFDNATESRISLSDPLKGHFEYSEYFHMPWVWNNQIKSALMIGLGGGSTALAWQHYYTNVTFEVVELDPKVAQVATKYFQVKETANLKIHIEDGRIFLRRAQQKYDVLLLDAYTTGRYGSSIPYSLVTKEFFATASEHLSTNGVIAYNVIGSVMGQRESIVSAIYKTMSSVFPRVYYFPANSSRNVVLVGTKSARPATMEGLKRNLDALHKQGWTTLPTFAARLENFRLVPPRAAARSRVLTDDFAPTDGMLSTEDSNF